ncbi:MAG: hypothetical protein QNJ90_10345 [Planctomycetota bacterium]|nr:hypothetical protein [Planctomycetota bacterium]
MSRFRARPARTSVLVLIVLVLALAQQASAAPPPPPSFVKFMISNQTGADVTNVAVTLIPSRESNRGQLDTTKQIVVSVNKLPMSASVEVNLPKTYGISRIMATGSCPNQLPSAVQITAEKANFDGNTGDEYAGFCFQGPSSSQKYTPELIFRKKANTTDVYEAHLQAKWRWGNAWAQQPETDTKQFSQ